MGVQACRLPALQRLPLKPLKPCKLCKSFSERRTAQAIALPQGHIASSCSQQAPQGHTSVASYGRPLPFASP